jgi:hypothetical protein
MGFCVRLMNWESQLNSPCNVRKYELFVSWKFVSRGSPLHDLLYFSSLNAILSLKISATVFCDIDKGDNHFQADQYVLLLVYNTEIPIRIREWTHTHTKLLINGASWKELSSFKSLITQVQYMWYMIGLPTINRSPLLFKALCMWGCLWY